VEEERLLVLQMVADGKITAEEAAALLRALEGTREKSSRPGAGSGAESWSELSRNLGELGQKLGEKAGPMAEAMAEKVEKLATRVTEEAGKEAGWLQSLLGNLNLGHLLGPQYKFEDVVTGTFPEEGKVRLDVSTYNGRIELSAWDRPEFEFRVVKTVRTPGSQEDAAALARKLAEFVQDGNGLKLAMAPPSGIGNCGVAVYGRLPVGRMYEAELRTRNGRIMVSGLQFTSLSNNTTNGRVVADQVSVTGQLEMNTSNGRIEFSGIASQLVARTSNGRIVVEPGPGAEGQYDLHTSNGSIRLQLVPSPEVGYDVDASTSNAKIVTELGEMENLVEEKSRGRQHIHARTRGFEGRPHRVRIRARTSNGPIRIGPHPE